MFRRVALAFLLLLFLSTQAICQVLVMVTGGDSLTGCSRDWFFHYLGVTSRGDCGQPAMQAATIYASGKILGVNMGISATKLDTGSNSFVTIGSTYIDPIVTHKTVGSFGGSTAPSARTYAVFCGIGTNDLLVGTQGTPAAYSAAHADDCAARKTAGFDKAIMVTVTPRGDGAFSQATWLSYNGFLLDPTFRATHNIDGVIDLTSEATCGVWTAPNDPTLYDASDKLHYTDLCGGLFATNVVTPAMRTYFPGLVP